MTDKIPDYQPQTGLQNINSGSSFQSQLSNVASQGNFYTELGANVAQAAHTELAKQQGQLAGQKPGGWWATTRAMFDKDFAQSYNTQATATLSLHANKLLLDSSLALDKDPNLNAQTIASSRQQVQQGLQTILDQAPTDVKPKLEFQYSHALQNQTAQFESKMIGQQQKAEKNTSLAYVKEANVNLYNTLMGDAPESEKAAQSIQELATSKIDNLENNKLIDPVRAQTLRQTLQQTAINAKYTKQAQIAYQNNNYNNFIADLASGKIAPEVKPSERPKLINAVSKYIGQMQNANAQNETIKMAQFQEEIIKDPVKASANLQSVMQELSQVNAAKMHLAWTKAMDSHQAKMAPISAVTSPGAYANLTAKQKNNAFQNITQNIIQNAQDNGLNISPGQAQMQAVSVMAGAVPDFVNSLENRMLNGSADDMLQAHEQYKMLQERNQGSKVPISQKARVATETFANLYQRMPLEQAQQKTQEIMSGVDVQRLDNEWAVHSRQLTAGGTTQAQAGLDLVNNITGNENFISAVTYPLTNPSTYGQMVFDKYKTYFYMNGGDADGAKKLVQQDVNNTFGHTQINGRKETTLYPIESTLGLPQNSTPIILDDIQKQMSEKLQASKQAYDQGINDYYYEVVPRMTYAEKEQYVKDLQKSQNFWQEVSSGVPFKQIAKERARALFHELPKSVDDLPDEPLMVRQVFRDGTAKEYPVVVQPSPSLMLSNNPQKPYVGGWDIGMQTSIGVQPINIDNPGDYLTYEPDAEKLSEQYLRYFPSGSSNIESFKNSMQAVVKAAGRSIPGEGIFEAITQAKDEAQ